MLHLKHLLLLAVLGTVALVLAAGDSFESYPLPSSSQPIQSTYGEETYALIQEDGTITFYSDSHTFSAYIPPSLRGDAYHIYEVKVGVSISVAVTRGRQIFLMSCSSPFPCYMANSPSSLPLSPLDSKVIAARPLDEGDSTIVVLASSHSIVTWNLQTNQKVSNLTWAFDNHYPFNHVSGLRLAGSGSYFLMIALANTALPSQPGVILKIKCDLLGHLTVNHPPGITYMTIAPMNFIVSRSYHTVRYWSQTNTDELEGYVNAYANQAWPPATTPLSTGQIISPSFAGEYPITESGTMAVGNPNTLGFDLLCLHFGYGKSSGPEVSITRRKHASSAKGLPILGFQTGPFEPEVVAVSRTASGWSIITVSFVEECRPPWVHASQNNEENRKPAPVSLVNSNCRPSSCNIDTDGDCTPQHCWGIAKDGSFLCCKHPPV
jgi:hypothetical protein